MQLQREKRKLKTEKKEMPYEMYVECVIGGCDDVVSDKRGGAIG